MRKYFSIRSIIDWWQENDPEAFDLDSPWCFRCLWAPPTPDWSTSGAYLDRAHLKDFCSIGPDEKDGPSNLVMLCHWCHRVMPDSENRDTSLRWVASGTRFPSVRQFVTDSGAEWIPSGGSSFRRIVDATVEELEAKVELGMSLDEALESVSSAMYGQFGRRNRDAVRSERDKGSLTIGGRRKFGWEQKEVVPHGHRAGRPTGPLSVAEEEARAIRDAAEMILSNWPLSDVLEMFEERGLKTPSGGPFNAASLKQVLCNPMHHEGGILSWDQHAALVAKIESAKGRVVGSRKSLLAGLIVCGGCGGRMYMGSGIYRCVSKGCASIRARELDELILDVAVRVLRDQGLSVSEDVWSSVSAGRARSLLDLLIDSIVVAPGVRGVKGFFPERVSVRWNGNDSEFESMKRHPSNGVVS